MGRESNVHMAVAQVAEVDRNLNERSTLHVLVNREQVGLTVDKRERVFPITARLIQSCFQASRPGTCQFHVDRQFRQRQLRERLRRRIRFVCEVTVAGYVEQDLIAKALEVVLCFWHGLYTMPNVTPKSPA